MENKIYDPVNECMDREQLRELQSERLRDTVKRVYENVPLYRKRMDEKGIKPEDIRSVDDLKYLPFTDKKDLRDEYPYGLLAVPKEEIVRIQGSSGTTGKPIVIGYTKHDVDAWSDMVARAITAAGGGPEDIVQVCYGYGLFTGGLGAHQGGTTVGAMVIPMSTGNTQRQVMMLKDMGTTILCCTPSYAAYLGEVVKEVGIKPEELKLKAGVLGGEPWSEKMRTAIEESLHINAYDIYGLSEITGPGVSFECCYKNGLHVNEDNFIPEIIDPVTEEPLPYGQTGELVFTTINKYGQPMIRYRTHDLCTLYNDPCPCGRTGVRMAKISGRTDDMLVIRGVNVFPSQVEGILTQTAGVAPHYILVVDRVNNSDTLEVKVELTEEMFSDTVSHIEAIQKYISDQVKSVLGIAAKISLVPPKSLPRAEGKAKHVIDNRNI